MEKNHPKKSTCFPMPPISDACAIFLRIILNILFQAAQCTSTWNIPIAMENDIILQRNKNLHCNWRPSISQNALNK